MEKSQLELTPFVMIKTQRDRPRWADAPSFMRTRRRGVRARSMWIKISICMALLAVVVLFELLLLSREEPSVAVSASEDASGTDGEESLGRLRFVEAGGVTSVFKVSQRWNAPVSATGAEKLEDGAVLKLSAEAGASVAVCASGEVLAVSQDDRYGAYVRVSHGSELESFYYNLSDITVEKGQPLSAQDTLGRAGADGCVYVRVRRAGAPVDPEDFIDLDGLN